MATKLRVVSKILECLQETRVAAAGCMLFLEELHNLPAIGQTFSTYFKGGIKSIFYQGWRLENVRSALSLNFAVSEFIARFSGELPNVRNWPRIHLPTRGETIHPLIIHGDVIKVIFDYDEFQPPENHVTSNEIRLIHHFVIHSRGELLVAKENAISIINRSGDRRTFCELREATKNLKGARLQVVKAMAVDRQDNVFVIIKFKDWISVYVLFVFDSSGVKKYENFLNFLDLDGLSGTVKSVVNNDDEFLMHVERSHRVYICDSTGALKFNFD